MHSKFGWLLLYRGVMGISCPSHNFLSKLRIYAAWSVNAITMDLNIQYPRQAL